MSKNEAGGDEKHLFFFFTWPKYLRYQWFNIQLLLEVTLTTRLTLRICQYDCYALYLQHFMPEFYRLKTLNTLEQVITSVIEKKNKPYEQNFDGKAKWSGFVNFHCMQMNRVMIIRFLGDDWNIMFPWF